MLGNDKVRLFLLLAALAACSDEPTGPRRGPIDLTAEWETATPASVGMDQNALNSALDHGGTLPRLLSVVVVRYGRIAAERYYNGNHVDSLNDVRSVTKSVVATIAGIVAHEGLLHEDSTIGARLNEWAGDLDAVRRGITVTNLLTMSSGLQWDESTTAGYNDWILSPDPIGYVLARPLANQRGSTFTYNSGAVHVLSVLIEKYTGQRINHIAQEKLWPRLGINRWLWEVLPQDGRPNGGSGLDLRPRDMAKLGWLWLEEGRANDTQLMDRNWVDRGTRPAFSSWWQTWEPLREQNYGSLWWLYRNGGRSAFFAWGHGGQFIWVDPELDLVVVVTNNWRSVPASDAAEAARAGLDLIINHIIPGVR
jgi:CubicO group peptidase (beta-lactamase class C family)